ncbi:hypothetical protein LCGC14_2274830 [marine sediment metagenome]|uniref:Uncharacterized protein n=1 Tax=marine sediment metagenome TaxID=412755 RepID=A0A0F9FR05_9ZZZZ
MIPFKPNANLQQVPEVKEGYVLSGGPVKWVPYKPQGAKQTNRKGRWKAMNEYGGWNNCETPAEVWPEFIDYHAQAARIAAFEAASLKILPLIEAAGREEVTDCADWDEAENMIRAAMKGGDA